MRNLSLFDSTANNLIDPLFRQFFSGQNFPAAFENQTIKIDVSETPEQYTVKADIPGVKKENLNVRVDRNVVQIDATVNAEKETKDSEGKVIYSERRTGALSRAFSLGQDVDDSKSVAKYDGGVLTLQLPKKAGPSVKQLAVQ
jgi:HSP20 family protein